MHCACKHRDTLPAMIRVLLQHALASVWDASIPSHNGVTPFELVVSRIGLPAFSSLVLLQRRMRPSLLFALPTKNRGLSLLTCVKRKNIKG
jgi:hypothetical protein